MKIRPIILSGGAGTRLWPLSRQLYPKQFLPLAGDNTMIQETVLRLDGLEGLEAPIVVCNEDHRFLAAEQLQRIGQNAAAIILEPLGRNTAPAIAAAAEYCRNNFAEDIMLVLPADHVITDAVAFQKAVLAGARLADTGALVTFGIVADRPETGYGYIKAGAKSVDAASRASDIERFVEKPDLPTAESYLKEGGYYWNSGMFMFRVADYLDELQKFNPAVAEKAGKALETGRKDPDFIRLDAAAFAESPSISIDYAVMEKTTRGVVIPLDAGWNDIGAWSALSDVNQQDADGNVVVGDVLLESTRNCYVRSSRRLVSVVGVSDHIIVETGDAVLVAHKDQVQNVKSIVDQLKQADRPEALNHLRVNRPWGTYETVDLAERYQVKRITVKPGAQLSLQMHHHRAEHWVVVKGTARIQRGEETILLSENQSTYIPLGVKHRLENPGKIPLELIEVQSGSYLGEDDIIRFDDNYGRS
jgi:mannose-1-phosphate guanylyltransferase/mannose-6-phosphate isomerase